MPLGVSWEDALGSPMRFGPLLEHPENVHVQLLIQKYLQNVKITVPVPIRSTPRWVNRNSVKPLGALEPSWNNRKTCTCNFDYNLALKMRRPQAPSTRGGTPENLYVQPENAHVQL